MQKYPKIRLKNKNFVCFRFQLLWLTCCKLKKDLEIEVGKVVCLKLNVKICFCVALQFLPVHRPSEAEKCDATLFARNVRREMAKYDLQK